MSSNYIITPYVEIWNNFMKFYSFIQLNGISFVCNNKYFFNFTSISIRLIANLVKIIA